MAPKRKEAVKEAASAPQVQSKKARNDNDKLQRELRTIIGSWEKAPIAEEVKNMLAEILPCSLAEFKEQRSKFQEQVVEEVACILAEVDASLNKAIDSARSKRNESALSKPLRDQDAQRAAANLQNAKDENLRLKNALATKARAFRAATAALVEAEEAKQADAQKSQEAMKQKGHFETALSDLNVLKVISPDDPEASKKQNELVSCMKKYKFEESILIALPAALAKAPEVRGQFDLMAAAQLEAEINIKMAEQEAVLAAAKPGQEKCEALVRQMQDQLNDRRLEQRVAAKSFDTSNKEWTAGEDAASSALKAVRELASSSKIFENAVYSAEVELELFQQGPMEAFTMLRERLKPAAGVEEQVEVAPVSLEYEDMVVEVQEEPEVQAVAAC